MNVHEYQAKELLKKYGIGIPNGHAALTVEEAVEGAKQLPGPLYVVKAQIHAGGRGKGKFTELGPDAKGGARLSKSIEEVEANAKEMLGNTLVTVQTGDAGKQVNRLYVTDGVDIAEEYYLAMLVDRATGRVAMIASTEGGMDIEDVAHETPEKITTITIDPAQGFMPHHGRAVAFALKLKAISTSRRRSWPSSSTPLSWRSRLRDARDQPAGRNRGRQSARSRHQDELRRQCAVSSPGTIEALRDETEEDPAEVEASEYDLAYIKLDGNIGCMVNGAGLAMATMDIIKLNGAFPANFLDVGGGATTEKVTAAFKIILKDPAVEGILVNIFGGIMKCDIIANGIVQAAKDVNLSVPLVVRLEGTNVEEGKAILDNLGLAIVSADDLGDAAKKIVAEVKQAA